MIAQGGRVYEVFQQGRSLTEPVASGIVELTFAHGAIDFAQVQPGQRVWKTDDPELTSRLRKTFTRPEPQRRTPVDLVVRAAVGQPLAVDCDDTASGIACSLAASQPLRGSPQASADRGDAARAIRPAWRNAV